MLFGGIFRDICVSRTAGWSLGHGESRTFSLLSSDSPWHVVLPSIEDRTFRSIAGVDFLHSR